MFALCFLVTNCVSLVTVNALLLLILITYAYNGYDMGFSHWIAAIQLAK